MANEWIVDALAGTDPDNFDVLMPSRSEIDFGELLVHAAGKGELKVCKWLVARGAKVDPKSLVAAGRWRREETCVWLIGEWAKEPQPVQMDGLYARRMHEEMLRNGWKPTGSRSYCSKSFFEANLKKDHASMNILESFFLGPFTQVQSNFCS